MQKLGLFGKDGVGKFALIDSEDYEKCIKHKWFLNQNGYVYAMNGKKHIQLHRFVMGFPDGIVDHKNRDKLDCRKSELRVCTSMENIWNAGVTSRSTTGYRGVYYVESVNKYQASIMVDSKRMCLGYFYDKECAAKARDVAAIKYCGEFAWLNFPDFDYTEYVPKPDMKEPTSKYSGINFNGRSNKWTSRIQFNNKRIKIGEYFTEMDAVKSRDLRIIQDDLPITLAFPRESYEGVEQPISNARKKSKYIGVSPQSRGGKRFEVKISVNKKNIQVGTFDTELQAAIAYDKYVRENGLNKRLNFPEPGAN